MTKDVVVVPPPAATNEPSPRRFGQRTPNSPNGARVSAFQANPPFATIGASPINSMRLTPSQYASPSPRTVLVQSPDLVATPMHKPANVTPTAAGPRAEPNLSAKGEGRSRAIMVRTPAPMRPRAVEHAGSAPHSAPPKSGGGASLGTPRSLASFRLGREGTSLEVEP